MSESAREHESAASGRVARCAVLTVSDTRTLATDSSGDVIVEILEAAGHALVARSLVSDDRDAIGAALDRWIDDAAIDVVLASGGTGVSRRDTTIEVVRERLTAELEGFGELFRMLSWDEVGPAAMMSRAAGGLVARAAGDTFVFAMPGSPNAVGLAMRRLIAPQLEHLVWERAR